MALLVLGIFPAAAMRAQTGGQPATGANDKQTGAASTLQAAPVENAPLPAPAMVGPLSTASSRTFDAGPFGKLDVTGILSGFGYWQGHPVSSDQAARADVSNGQIFIQKTGGLVQYFLQAGAYNLPALGTPFLSTRNTISDYFGPLPQAYLKLAPKGNFSFLIGKLPSFIGAEDTFTFENLDIERGLLWNQENNVNRGMQVNCTKGKLSSSLSWNDGFYSNRYNWLDGELTYTANAANIVEVVASGNLGRTAYSSVATPLYQNNSDIYDLIYTHTAKRWMIEPYFQYTYVPLDVKIGVGRATATQGEAMLCSYSLAHDLTMAGRVEYISSTGSIHNGAVNLLYGPGSRAWSLTLTPTYQKKAFFARGEFSVTQAVNYTPGDAFGPTNSTSSQTRGVVETGFMF
ncbi:MAG: outer membrane beta-barrel protein [Acidobacteriaceae bacterium]